MRQKADEQLDAELLDRIRLLEKNSNEIKKMSRRDYILVGVAIAVCFLFVVIGAFI